MGSSDLDSAARSLQAGQTLLAQGQAEAALPLLLAARDDAAQGDADTRLQAHNLIERHGLPGAFSAWMGVCCEISPLTEMFGRVGERGVQVDGGVGYINEYLVEWF